MKESMPQPNKHWQEEDLLARLYGLTPEAEDAHLAACLDCRARWDTLVAARRGVLVEPLVPEYILHAQRRAIFARIDRARSPWRWIPVPVLATAAVLALGIALHQPAPVPAPQQTAAISDTQLMNEIATMANQEEPRATETLKGLFAEAQ